MADQNPADIQNIGQVLGPTSPFPVQAQAPQMPTLGASDSDIDRALKLQLLSQGEQGMQMFRDAATRQAADEARVKALQGEQSGLHVAYQPHFKPPNSIGNVLGDIGKGLLTLGASTGPGQAAQQVLYSEPRHKYQQIAQQIEQIKGQEEERARQLEPAAQLAYRAPMGYGSIQRGTAEMMNAQTRQAYDKSMVDLKGQMQQITKDLGQGKLTQEAARTEAMKVIAAHHDSTIQSVAGMYSDQRDRDAQINAMESEYKTDTDNMIRQFLGGLVGISPTAPSKKGEETAPQGPKARGSKVGGATTPSKPSKPSTGGVVKWGRDKQGNPVPIQQ